MQSAKAKKPTSQNHVLFMYDSREERMRVLAEYFGDGLKRGELCIFVTPDPEQTAENFRVVGLDVRQAIEKGSLRVFEMGETYLPSGKFAADFMLSNVKRFIKDAKAGGYKGLRTAGEMSWLHDHPEFVVSATKYEEQISGLAGDHSEFTVLCLYPLRESPGDVLDTAMRTHPSFIYDGTVQMNPFGNRSVPG